MPQTWFKDVVFEAANPVMLGQKKKVLEKLFKVQGSYPIKKINYHDRQWKFTGQSGITIALLLKRHDEWEGQAIIFQPGKETLNLMKEAIQQCREWNNPEFHPLIESMAKAQRRETLSNDYHHTMGFTHVWTSRDDIAQYIANKQGEDYDPLYQYLD